MNDIADNPRRMLRIAEVEHLTGLPRSTIYERIADNQFPKSIRIGRRSVAWKLADINQWLDDLVAKESQCESRSFQ